MPPNPMFAKFDQALGKTTPTPTDGKPPVQSRADQIRALGKANTPAPAKKPFGAEPSFKASIGGAETIIPNTLKTIGNIPSDIANIADTAIQSTAGNIGKSLGVAQNIYKDRGFVQGTKDIAGGFSDTLSNIFQAPGKAIVGQNDKMDLINHLAPIQDQALKQRDTILQKITDAKKAGTDTTHLVTALKYVQENLQSLNDQIGSKEDRQNQGVNTLTDVIKYPIEHPAQVAIAAETLKPETQATIANKIKPVTSKIETGVNAVKNTASDLANVTKNKIAEKTALKETQKIQDMISPKLTPKEIKLAEKQGRIIPGKDPTLLRGGTPDTVIPADKVVRATQTVQREIPNASKLKEPELYTALDGRTTDMAQKLQPEMQKVKITKPTVEKITSDWEKLKIEQKNNAYTPSDVNIKKLQADFESRLQKSKSGTMDDLWNTRKEYDTSVPSNVKKANSMSSESLQAKKEIWLQNRDVLNRAIEDSKLGLGEKAQTAFSDMTDMYGAKENLISKAKVELKPQPNKIIQWIKDNPYKAGAISLGIGQVTGANKVVGGAIKAMTGL